MINEVWMWLVFFMSSLILFKTDQIHRIMKEEKLTRRKPEHI